MNTEKFRPFGDLPTETITVLPEGSDADASTGILLSTLWNQSGVLEIGDNMLIAYNEYTPLDPTNSKHCLTGCTNTAAAQIIYYFIKKELLELSLTLNADDAYDSVYDDIRISIKSDGSTPGTISFAAVNNYLEHYTVGSAECAAALLYACGVVQKASYSSSATSTAWSNDLFYRAGFQCVIHVHSGTALSDYWGTKDGSGNFSISDAGFEVLIENLQAGRPVGTSYPGHALVIDGYDAEKDLFHINFGWGNSSSTRWYTRDEMRQKGYHQFVYDLFTERIETFTVTADRVYGTGTMVRAFEQAAAFKGDSTVLFADSVKGRSVELSEYIRVYDTTVIRGFNMAAMVTNNSRWSWGVAFYGMADSITVFEGFGGELVVNTGLSVNAAMFFSKGGKLSFSGDNALLYGGSYAVGGNYSSGAAAILEAMRKVRDKGGALDAFVKDTASYSFYGSAGSDSVILANRSLVVGSVHFANGDDTLTVTGGSRLYGNVTGGGTFVVSEGAWLYGNIGGGTITIDSTAAVSGGFSAQGNVTFVLDSAAQDHALFTIESNVYSVYKNAVVTVDATDAKVGTYTIFSAAESAAYADYLNRINLKIVGDGVSDYTLCGNGVTSGNCIDLICETGALKLDVRATPADLVPRVISVSADVTTATNRDVIVTATFSKCVTVMEYSLDNKNWHEYTTGVVMTDNGTVRFRGTDAGGTVSKVTEFAVTNIDRTPPDKPVVKADVTKPTIGDVTVTAEFSDDSTVREYSLDGETWRTYAAGIVMTDNGKIFFRAADAAGNVSEAAVYEVANIYKTAPDAPAVTLSTTALTNENVTVTAAFTASCVIRQYSTDGEKWLDYTAPLTVGVNGTYYFRGIDPAGNESAVTRCVVTNIDRTAPDKPAVSADITVKTNKNVTVTAAFPADAAVREYSFDQKTWQAYTSGVVMKENGRVYFRGTDAAGNVSATAVYEVANIDRTAPDKPVVSADITAPTNGNVTVSAVFASDSTTKQYSLDNALWRVYTGGVVLTANGKVYFRALNAAGNASEVAEYEVANIDRVAPDKPTVSADVADKRVTVTASFSADSVTKQYSLDDLTWQPYASGVVMTKNGKVYFRGIDAAGNVSEVASYKVSTLGAQTVTTDLSKRGELAPGREDAFTPKLAASGLYTVTGTFGTMKGTVTVVDKAGKKVGSGAVKNGVVTFKKELLLDKGTPYTVVVKNTDKNGRASAYNVELKARELFTRGDNSDDTLKGAKTLAAGSNANDWVGYGDAVDYYKLGVDARGGFYDLSISGVKNNVKLTIYSAAGKKVKTVTATATKPAIALADLCLASGSYAVVEAPKAAKAQNSDYKLTLSEKAVFTGAANDEWAHAEVLAKGATFSGTLTKAAGGDGVDYCDVSGIDKLTFDMTAGKTKVTFFDEQHKKLKVAVTMANDKVKTASSLTLAAKNGTTDHFTIAAVDAVRYLKIEASGKGLNTYTIGKLA